MLQLFAIETCQKTPRRNFVFYFGPSSALHCVKTDLLIEYGEEYYKIASDSAFVPSVSVVHKLFKTEFLGQYGCLSGEGMFNSVVEMLKEYSNESKGVAKYEKFGDHYFIILCTPIMLRAHESLVQTSELVMVDAAGGMDRQRHRIYFFVTPTAAGGVPVNLIITDSEKEEVFYAAVSRLKEVLPDKAFFGKKYRKVFLTDNDLKERKPLQELFPNSRTLLCQFHMLKAVWAWLFHSKHGINKNHRQELYFMFKN